MNYVLGKFYRDKTTGTVMKLTGVDVCTRLSSRNNVTFFVELTFEHSAYKGAYICKRPVEVCVSLVDSTVKEAIDAIIASVLKELSHVQELPGVPQVTPEAPQATSEDGPTPSVEPESSPPEPLPSPRDR